MEAQLVLYDEDCGICTSLAGMLDRRGVAVAAIGSSQGERWLNDLPPALRYSSVHAIDTDGTRRSGGAAVPHILRALPGGRPLATAAAAFPRLTDALYARLTRHRRRLSAILGQRACGTGDLGQLLPDHLTDD